MGHKTKLKRYIKDDRPLKLKSYVTSHKLYLEKVMLGHRRNLLHYCAQHGTADMLRCLLKMNCDPSQQDKDGNLPLHLALQRGFLESIQQARETLLDMVTPLLEAYPLGQDVENKEGATGQDLLTSLKKRIKSQLSCSTLKRQAETDRNYDGDDDESWRQKLSEEASFEHEEGLPRYSYSDDVQQEQFHEPAGDWFEEVRKEYTSKRSRKLHTFWRDKKQKISDVIGGTSGKKSHKQNTENDKWQNAREEMKKQYKPQPSVDHLILKKKRYESKFTYLLGHLSGRTLTYACIPWPSPDISRVVDVLMCDLPDNKSAAFHKYLRGQQIRWHPDKFMQKLGDHLHPDHKAKILNRVMAISQILNGLKTKVNQ
ncbi:unnamed protein product [Candidula unifasciata]|uniref:NF-kappa-B inhibitor-like protein 1 n=1 Tax=Candidula unifasciata TaxID=100452 RepID=A0A8S3YEJ6_9EUPU|nr:unnamed protein product [Candidula unifasciata]